jgi:uncharacterized protein involved in exopolysaccharide biosynthesis
MTAMRFLHLAGRRLVIVVVVAALAFVVAGGYAYAQPIQYRAQSTVFVARVFPSGAAGVDSAVADFETVMGLAQVRRAVAAKTGASTDALASALRFHRVGGSSALQVSFHSSSRDRAANVVTTASQAALSTLAQQQLDGAREAVAASQPAVDAALKDVQTFQQNLGVADLEVEYQARQQELLNLENQLANAGRLQVQSINAQITTETAEVNRLAAARPQFQQLQDKLTQARASLDGASGALVDAQGRIAAANSPTVITTPEVTKQSRLLPVLRASLITALVAVLLGIGLYTLVDWLTEDRERRTAEDVAAEPSLGVPALGRDTPGQERAAPA